MKLIDILIQILLFCVVYVVISLSWIGAEYLFDGVVHTSHVDGFFAGILSYCITKDLIRLDKELGERKEGAE